MSCPCTRINKEEDKKEKNKKKKIRRKNWILRLTRRMTERDVLPHCKALDFHDYAQDDKKGRWYSKQWE